MMPFSIGGLNYSLLLADGQVRLAPLYDVLPPSPMERMSGNFGSP